MATMTERVAAGAAWLDENQPGWWQRIDLATLDLASSCRCILGQLAPPEILNDHRYPTWPAILDHFTLTDADVRLGFNVAPDGSSWARLTREWAGLIERRQSA